MMTAEEFAVEWLPIVADREWFFNAYGSIRKKTQRDLEVCPVCETMNEIEGLHRWFLAANTAVSGAKFPIKSKQVLRLMNAADNYPGYGRLRKLMIYALGGAKA